MVFPLWALISSLPLNCAAVDQIEFHPGSKCTVEKSQIEFEPGSKCKPTELKVSIGVLAN